MFLPVIALCFILFVSPVFGVTSNTQPTTWQEAVYQANEDLGFEYFKETNKNGLTINKDLAIGKWSTYKGSSNINFGSALAYGPVSGIVNGIPRYLGQTRGGDVYSNAYFPMDKWVGGHLEDRNWILNPWDDSDIKANAKDKQFDNPIVGDKYLDNIIRGMELFYSDILSGEYKNIDWTLYVHVLQPPTKYSFGAGRMWHRDNAGKIWYLAVPIAPFYSLTPDVVSLGTADGCFLDVPKKVGSNMEVYIIRGPRHQITEPIYVPIKIYLLQNVDKSIQFAYGKIPANIGWGDLIFDDIVKFTPDKPYWVKKITYPVPLDNHKSGIFVQTGMREINSREAVVSYSWNYVSHIAWGSHTLSSDEFMDYLPWSNIEVEFDIKRLK
jgi:hypothetical protein